MKQKFLLGGLGVAFGVYLYEVIGNLYNEASFPVALINVDWLRVLFIGLFSMGFVAWLERRKQKD